MICSLVWRTLLQLLVHIVTALRLQKQWRNTMVTAGDARKPFVRRGLVS
jgi:hypothetical protein